MNDIEKNIPPKLHLGPMGKGKNKPYGIMWGPDRSLDAANGTIVEKKRYWRLDLDHSHSTMHHILNQVRKGNMLVGLFNLDKNNDDHNQIQDYFNGVSHAILQTMSSVGIEATVERLKKQRAAQSNEKPEPA